MKDLSEVLSSGKCCYDLGVDGRAVKFCTALDPRSIQHEGSFIRPHLKTFHLK